MKASAPEDKRLDDFRKQIYDLKDKLEAQNNEIFDILRYFELAVVDTKDDMRILNSNGATEIVFQDAGKMFEQGNSLVNCVYKITRNSKAKPDAEELESAEKKQEREDLETTVNRFVASHREEKVIKIVGERNDGEVFLLVWKMKKLGKNYRSFFKVIPTNAIIKAMQDKQGKELDKIRSDMRTIFENIGDGVTILDLKNKIIFMNEAAKAGYASYQNILLKNANFEGRLFQEIFPTEDPDEIKARMEFNHRTIMLKQHLSYSKNIGDKVVTYNLYPMYDNKHHVNALLIISKLPTPSEERVDSQKLLNLIKGLSSENKRLFIQTREQEENITANLIKLREFQEASRIYLQIIDKFPLPACLLQYPSRTIVMLNDSFEILVNKTKDVIKGKKDSELFSADVTTGLGMKIEESLQTKNTSVMTTASYKINQLPIYNLNNEVAYIFRYYETNAS